MLQMVKTVLINMVSKPATRQYPFEVRPPFAKARGQVTIEQDQCIYCGICQKKCPTDCITVSRQEKTWALNSYGCVICGVCVEACPKKCLHMQGEYKKPTTEKIM